jgi:hypothetical protein
MSDEPRGVFVTAIAHDEARIVVRCPKCETWEVNLYDYPTDVEELVALASKHEQESHS